MYENIKSNKAQLEISTGRKLEIFHSNYSLVWALRQPATNIAQLSK